MTDEERAKSILAELEHNYIGYGNMHEDYEQGCRVIETALKKTVLLKHETQFKQEKYVWHDLRKNPDDLPSGEVTGRVEFYSKNGYKFCGIYFKGVFIPYLATEYIHDVVAWREIEPFEEEEDD